MLVVETRCTNQKDLQEGPVSGRSVAPATETSTACEGMTLYKLILPENANTALCVGIVGSFTSNRADSIDSAVVLSVLVPVFAR